MRDLINSMIRFSTAISLFTFQQMQSAMNVTGADTDSAVTKFSEALDRVTKALTDQMDDKQKPTYESVTKAGTDMWDKTWDSLRLDALDPRTVVKASRDVIEKTAGSLNDFIRKPAANSSAEPKPAAEALSGHPAEAAPAS